MAGERARYTAGTGRGHPKPTRIRGGVGGTHRKPKTWGPRKLMAPSHGHPFPSVLGSKWQFKRLPGSGPSLLAYLGTFMGLVVPMRTSALGISLLIGSHLAGSHLGSRLLFSKGEGEDQEDGGTVGAPQWEKWERGLSSLREIHSTWRVRTRGGKGPFWSLTGMQGCSELSPGPPAAV